MQKVSNVVKELIVIPSMGVVIHVLAEGRLVNLATPKGMGHPVEVMDLSFAIQALSSQYIAERASR
jgi:adenosylhomocysteinase